MRNNNNGTGHGNGYQGVDAENEFDEGPEVAFLKDVDAATRNGFIRKVYSILAVQLFVTAIIAGAISTSTQIQSTLIANPSIVTLVSFLLLGFVVAAMCCQSVLRQYPHNYMFLAGFTCCEAFLVGVITIQYKASSVVTAVMLTALLTAGLTAYAWTTKSDFTGMGPYLFAASLGLMAFSFIFFFTNDALMHKIYAGCGVALFSIYLVYDTQLIVGGKRMQFTVDDYAFAALHLYLDIVNLFIYILSLMGEQR